MNHFLYDGYCEHRHSSPCPYCARDEEFRLDAKADIEAMNETEYQEHLRLIEEYKTHQRKQNQKQQRRNRLLEKIISLGIDVSLPPKTKALHVALRILELVDSRRVTPLWGKNG